MASAGKQAGIVSPFLWRCNSCGCCAAGLACHAWRDALAALAAVPADKLRSGGDGSGCGGGGADGGSGGGG
eukprot:1396548-Pleurochrysis_carterae.AAC.1